MGRSDLPSVFVLAAMLVAPLRVASAEPPTPAKTTAEPPAPAPSESAPPPSGEPTPEQRAKELGWDDEEPATQPATPAEGETTPEGEENEDEEEEEPEEPDVDDVIDADPVLEKDYRRARGMAIGGGSVAGVGLILVASGAYFVAAESVSRDSAGALSNRGRLIGGWVTMGIGLAALSTGIIVMALGLAKRKRVLTEAEARLPPTAMVSPWFDERGGGAGLTLRF